MGVYYTLRRILSNSTEAIYKDSSRSSDAHVYISTPLDTVRNQHSQRMFGMFRGVYLTCCDYPMLEGQSVAGTNHDFGCLP